MTKQPRLQVDILLDRYRAKIISDYEKESKEKVARGKSRDTLYESAIKRNSYKMLYAYIEKLRKDQFDMLGSNREYAKLLKLELQYKRAQEKEEIKYMIRVKMGESHTSGDFTLAEIGNILGLTRERVRQLEDAAIKKMKHPKQSRDFLDQRSKK